MESSYLQNMLEPWISAKRNEPDTERSAMPYSLLHAEAKHHSEGRTTPKTRGGKKQ